MFWDEGYMERKLKLEHENNQYTKFKKKQNVTLNISEGL